MTAPAPDDLKAVRAWVREQLKDPNTSPLRASLLKTWSNAYVAGGIGAVENGRLPKALSGITDFQDWKAGNGAAADLLDEGGWKQLLDAADVTVKSIADTSLDRVGSLLAAGASSGDSVDGISASIRDFLDNPERADMIATTELARATELASMDSYAANGISQWDWILSPDACRFCTEQAGGNPHSLGDVTPPLHPNCECASAPIDSGGNEGSPGTDDGSLGDGGGEDLPLFNFDDILSSADEGGADAVAQAMSDIAGRAWSDLGYTLDHDDTILHDGMRLEFTINDPGGNYAGALQRQFTQTKDGLSVENVLFMLPKNHQGQGLATKLAPKLEEWYKANGIKQITVHANIDVGGYTWAKQGFGWDPAQMSGSGVQSLIQRIAAYVHSFEEEAALNALKAQVTDDPATWPTPYDLAMWGYKPGDTTWAGQQGMLGSNWRGVKKL